MTSSFKRITFLGSDYDGKSLAEMRSNVLTFSSNVRVPAIVSNTFVGDFYGNIVGVSGSFSGVASAGFFIGNGSLLTGLTISSNTLPPVVTADLIGNVTGNLIHASVGILSDGAVTADNFFGNLSGNVSATQVVATGNVSANFFVGNGAFLTGISQNALPDIIEADLLGNVAAVGNVSAGHFVGNGAFITGLTISSNTLPSIITADFIGNVTATFVNATANIQTTGNMIVGNVLSMGSRVQNNLVSLYGNTAPSATDQSGFGTSVAGDIVYTTSGVNLGHRFYHGTQLVASIGRSSGNYGASQVRLASAAGNQRTAILYGDGTNFYVMATVANDPDGPWFITPFNIDLSTGKASFSAGVGITGGGLVVSSGVMAWSGALQNNILSLTACTDTTSVESYGFGMAAGTLRYGAAALGQHKFYVSGTGCATISTAGLSVDSGVIYGILGTTSSRNPVVCSTISCTSINEGTATQITGPTFNASTDPSGVGQGFYVSATTTQNMSTTYASKAMYRADCNNTTGAGNRRAFQVTDGDTVKAYMDGLGAVYATQLLTNNITPGASADIFTYCDQNVGWRLTGTGSSAFRFEMSTNTAYKAGSAVWVASSDSRVKTDIVPADLDICYDNVKTLKLQRFRWDDSVPWLSELRDRHVIGWIAQEVERVIPKAVVWTEQSIPDPADPSKTVFTKGVDADQILKAMYGALQKTMANNEALEVRLAASEDKASVLETRLMELERIVAALGV